MTKAEYNRAYRVANRDKIRARMREYLKEYRLNNKERIAAIQRRSQEKHREKIRERTKAHRQNEEVLAQRRMYQQRWRTLNPERQALYDAKSIICGSTGLPRPQIPDDLAQAKAAQLLLVGELKNQK